MTDVIATLDEAIPGRSDEEILGLLEELGGAERVLAQGFELFADRLNPDEAEDCTVMWRLAAPAGTLAFTVVVRDREAWIERDRGDAALTFDISVPDYLRLVRGHIDPARALVEGRLSLEGDLRLADRFRRMFRPREVPQAPAEEGPPPHTPGCFGCGDGPVSLGLSWSTDGRLLTSSLTLDAAFEGMPGHAHGGVVAAVFDELLAALAQHVAFPSVTTRLEVTYLEPVPLGRELSARCWVEDGDGATTALHGTLHAGDRALARAVGEFRHASPQVREPEAAA